MYRYLGDRFQRIHSYHQQLCYVADANPKSLLLIGKGPSSMVEDLLARSGVYVSSLDIDLNLKPDIIGSVESLPLSGDSFDVTLCCQVLEHIPFERFEDCLDELKRITRKRVVLSIPDMRRFFGIRLTIGRWQWSWQATIPRISAPTLPKSRLEAHGHYWEIGFRGYPFKRILAALRRSEMDIVDIKRVYDLSWHTFFILDL